MPTKKIISIVLIQIFSIFLLTACGSSSSGGSSNTDPSLNNASFNVLENATNGTKVGNALVATDPDAQDVLTYKITNGNTGTAFAISATTGQITVAKATAFNPLPTSPYKLTVEVSDGAGGTGTATITITVDDVNLTSNIPKTITVDTSSLNVGPALGSADDGLTYSIVGGNTNGAFAIDPETGQITIVNPSAIHPGDTFQLVIQATDGTLTDTVTIAISIPSTSILPDGLNNVTIPSIDKGSIKNGLVVTTLGAFDGITYSITGFNADSPFAIDPVTGEITINNSAAVKLGENTLEILVSNGVVSEVLTLTITINDVSIIPDGHSLSGDNPTVTIGTPLGSADDGLTYGIVEGGDSASFTIDPQTGQISVNDGANLGSGSYTLTISVTTEGGITENITVTVVIQTPPVISFTKTKDLLRRAAAGTVVGAITVEKKDAESIGDKALNTSGTSVASPEFQLEGDKVVLKPGVTLTENSYTLDAIYSSDAGVSNTLPITVKVVDDFKGRVIKVIPFGNSLTAGEGYSTQSLLDVREAPVIATAADVPANADGNSYRFVIDKFHGNGVNIDFLGSKNPGDWGAIDGDHEGWAGFNSETIIHGEGSLPPKPLELLMASGLIQEADVILMTLGINDALTQAVFGGDIGEGARTKENLEDIIDQMREKNPNLVFLLANLPPIDTTNNTIFKFGKYDMNVYNFENPAQVQEWIATPATFTAADRAEISAKLTADLVEANTLVAGINVAINSVANDASTTSSPVIAVDMKEIFAPGGVLNKALTSDGIHPNNKGEEEMAKEWVDILNQFVDGEAE